MNESLKHAIKVTASIFDVDVYLPFYNISSNIDTSFKKNLKLQFLAKIKQVVNHEM